MFVGHYGPSFAIKSIQPSIPLWVLFIAVQLLDVGWSVLVFLGVEKVRDPNRGRPSPRPVEKKVKLSR